METQHPGEPRPSLDELLARTRVVRIPLAVSFRGVTEREVALFEGPAGWGEFSPFLEYAPAEAATWLAAGIEAAWLGFPAPVRTRVPVNATVPAVDVAGVERVLSRYAGALDGARPGRGLTVKVKVAEQGQCLEDDLARVARVRALAPEAHIRVDANMGWGTAANDPDEPIDAAVDALTCLSEHGLQYAEQPVASVSGLRRVRFELARRGVPVLIAADESIRKAEDPLLVAREDAADLVVVKYSPLGGARRALRVIEASGLPAVISSALDTSVGLSAGVALAAALPSLDYACGLGTLSLADDDVALAPLRVEHGRMPDHLLSLGVGPVQLDPERLDALAAPSDRVLAWHGRIRDCHAVLERAALR